MSVSAPPAAISELRERIARLDGGNARARAVLPFGVAAIDRVLPGGGLAFGGLHEVAGGGNGAVDGAAAALFAAGIAAGTAGKVLWCVTRPDLFAPAIEQAGLPPGRVIYVEAGDEKSVLASFEEGLRGGFGAVVAEIARLSMTASRRLQLAAESSGAISRAGEGTLDGEVGAEPIATALVLAGHLGRGMAELLLHVSLLNVGRGGKPGAQRVS
ncbi:hypothetical protein ABVK50_30170 (plasmid) [Mesorhizobium sp. WSM2240]|uniref:Damage-inducible protein n=1 Tax=Mesorhizobium sp. WSM2240 TaxID=3228851 RepID=A0AAU8CZU8_9HYPH